MWQIYISKQSLLNKRRLRKILTALSRDTTQRLINITFCFCSKSIIMQKVFRDAAKDLTWNKSFFLTIYRSEMPQKSSRFALDTQQLNNLVLQLDNNQLKIIWQIYGSKLLLSSETWRVLLGRLKITFRKHFRLLGTRRFFHHYWFLRSFKPKRI